MAIAREAEPVGSLQEVKEAGLDREDLLGIYRNMLITRGVEERGHILYKQGKIPGSFYTGPRQRGARRSASRRRWARTTSARRSTATWASTSRAASSRGGSSPSTWAAPTGRRTGSDGNVHMADARLGLIAMVSHLPAMLPGRGRLRARLPDPRGAARRGRLVRRGRVRARRRARGR